MRAYVLGLQEVGRTAVAAVGGKGANLGELAKLDGIRVPDAFCVATDAFKHVMARAPALPGLLDRLALLKTGDLEALRDLAATVRATITGIPIPDDVQSAITSSIEGLGGQAACAVRSSATAEDLPWASFAGQQDTYLNVVGTAAILKHISKCWASLFTDRAVSYRLQHGLDHRKVHMAVVVQRMIVPSAAGVCFTADPVTGNRKVTSIEAVLGLGDSLVSGLVHADSYKVKAGQIVEAARQAIPALTDAQVVEIERIGRHIESHFSLPQDIEWCLVNGEFHIVQSRPITTLFPVPDAGDGHPHVFVSVGHQQMMTDPLKPLGVSLWQLTAARPMYAAGGRIFVDVAKELASPASCAALLAGFSASDPLTGAALTTVVERGGFLPAVPNAGGPAQGTSTAPSEADPSIVAELIARSQMAIDGLRQTLQTKSGTGLIDFVIEDAQHMRKANVDGKNMAAIMAFMNAAKWINERMLEWLGEKNAADAVSQSVANNVTSEMGLALLDVADVIRPLPRVIAYLQTAKDDGFFEGLLLQDGGRQAHDAIRGYLNRYGMRCTGEIDVTRTRWSESPTTLVPLVLSNIKNFQPGAGVRKFEQGKETALKKEAELLERLKHLPDGEEKAASTQRMIQQLRHFAGYREYPKYAMVSRYFLYKQALLEEAARLVDAGVMETREDIYFLTMKELSDVVRTHALESGLISQRKSEHDHNAKLKPPRVMTSDGEIINGAYPRDHLPKGALIGLAVSSGVVEGRARVLVNMADAELETGDILVTAFTDPSWTPLFVSIAGLVTEVGGLMTHGAVIAREYGLPAVIGVENATRLIRDGQRIRVNGTDGCVELL